MPTPRVSIQCSQNGLPLAGSLLAQILRQEDAALAAGRRLGLAGDEDTARGHFDGRRGLGSLFFLYPLGFLLSRLARLLLGPLLRDPAHSLDRRTRIVVPLAPGRAVIGFGSLGRHQVVVENNARFAQELEPGGLVVLISIGGKGAFGSRGEPSVRCMDGG